MPYVKETKCWSCQNACGDCSWSNHWEHKPVEGWTAIPVQLRLNRGEYAETYIVKECPEYIPDPPRKNDKNRDETK